MRYVDSRTSPDAALVRVGESAAYRGTADGGVTHSDVINQFWTDRASCREYDPEIFFALDGTTQAVAEAICEKCPVRVECEALADIMRPANGVWAAREVTGRSSSRTSARRRYASTIAKIIDLGQVPSSS